MSDDGSRSDDVVRCDALVIGAGPVHGVVAPEVVRDHLAGVADTLRAVLVR